MNQTQHIETLDFRTDPGLGAAARIGLIVLQTDRTLEHELSRLLTAEDVAVYHARIPNAPRGDARDPAPDGAGPADGGRASSPAFRIQRHRLRLHLGRDHDR